MSSLLKYYLVIDLGTSTLAGRLFSCNGILLAETRLTNPQRELGADILSRLQVAHEEGSERLQALLVQGLKELVIQITGAADCSVDDIGSVAVAGNPGMSCLLLGHSVETLLFPPHRPSYKSLLVVATDEIDIGLSIPLQMLPPVSGYVGGDLVACLLSIRDVKPATILIDVGTNAEIALWDGSKWWVTSAAAGPAFEGGNIGSGMMAQAGAVCNVVLLDDQLRLEVVGGRMPLGLCGSGLAALVSALLEAGLIDASGRIVSPQEVETNMARYLVKEGDIWAICYHRSATSKLLLTQEDVRNFQLAKGAVQAGVKVLLERSCLSPDEVYEIVLTGALGTSLPTDVLKRVALLPEAMLDRTSFVENGVLTGLQKYLQNADDKQQLETLLQKTQPFPLSGTPAFEKLFLSSLEF